MAPPETVFGHEFIGDIVEVGPKVPEGMFAPGDRVTSLPFIGEKTIGLGEISGAYSEYVRVGHELVLKVPESLDDNSAALIEPLAVGLHSVKMAEGISEKDVLVIGAGPIGLACAIWSRFLGARSVLIKPSLLHVARLLLDVVVPLVVVAARGVVKVLCLVASQETLAHDHKHLLPRALHSLVMLAPPPSRRRNASAAGAASSAE